MEKFVEAMIFVLGLCVGSFINMAIYRIKRKESFFKEKRSFCDFCKRQLKWYDNIPLLSWLFYGGKSHCCQKKLPLLYPIVEISTGVLFLINFKTGGGIINYVIWGLLIFEAAFDFKEMLIPDSTAFSLIILAAVNGILTGRIISNLWPALISGLFMFCLHLIKIRGQEAMGDGDILLAVFMGLFLGFPNIVLAFYIAFIGGALVGVFLIAQKKVRRLSPIPFGPFLIMGTLVAFFWGENIMKLIV